MPPSRPQLSSSSLTNILNETVHPDSIQAQWQAGIDARRAASPAPDRAPARGNLTRMLLALRGTVKPSKRRAAQRAARLDAAALAPGNPAPHPARAKRRESPSPPRGEG